MVRLVARFVVRKIVQFIVLEIVLLAVRFVVFSYILLYDAAGSDGGPITLPLYGRSYMRAFRLIVPILFVRGIIILDNKISKVKST